MKSLIWALAALSLSGCAWFAESEDLALVSPALADPENVVPASYAPAPAPKARVASGRPSAIVPCVTGARISDLCRRDAEAHLYAAPAETPQ
jgi:hypothetical protein